MRELLATDVLGKLARYEAHFDRFRPELRPGAWREHDEPGSGLLFDLGPHLIDQGVVAFWHAPAAQCRLRDAILWQAALDVTSQQALDVMRALELARESTGCIVPWPKTAR